MKFSHKIGYLLIRTVFKGVGMLPMGVLYFLADCTFVSVYYVMGYRKKVVADNLLHAFPEKSEAERAKIGRDFYRHLADMLAEFLKMAAVPASALQHRYEFDASVFEPLFDQKKNVYLSLAHQFNWELGAYLLNDRIPHDWAVLYTPLSHPVFERFFLETRTRAGAKFFSLRQLPSLIKQLRSAPTAVGLAADQSPAHLPSARWFTFMNRPAPFHPGIEDLARKFGGAVVFLEIVRVKRGYYRAETCLFTEDASAFSEGMITQAYVSFVEESLRRHPENYLWSHRRWKHTARFAEFNLPKAVGG